MYETYSAREISKMLPAILSFIAPLLVIKEYPTSVSSAAMASTAPAEDVIPLWECVKLTLGNRTFRTCVFSLAAFFFGLWSFSFDRV